MEKLYAFWNSPVYIRSEAGAAAAVEGPGEAVDLLQTGRMPAAGPHCQRALQICRAATSQTGLLGASREAFVAATLEAGILWPSALRRQSQPMRPLPKAPQAVEIGT